MNYFFSKRSVSVILFYFGSIPKSNFEVLSMSFLTLTFLHIFMQFLYNSMLKNGKFATICVICMLLKQCIYRSFECIKNFKNFKTFIYLKGVL